MFAVRVRGLVAPSLAGQLFDIADEVVVQHRRRIKTSVLNEVRRGRGGVERLHLIPFPPWLVSLGGGCQGLWALVRLAPHGERVCRVVMGCTFWVRGVGGGGGSMGVCCNVGHALV